MADPFSLEYSPPGEVARAFLKSQLAEPKVKGEWQTHVKGLRGPLGSGKSVACVIAGFLHACQQETVGGIKRARAIVTRNTYAELKSTTIKTWQDWLPAEIAPIKHDAPIECNLEAFIPTATGGYTLQYEALFLSLDTPAHVKKLRSLEGSWGWMNEAKEQPKSTLDMLTGRVSRYPPKKWGGTHRPTVVMDTNSPDDDHWYYELANVIKPRNYDFFTQPPALIKVGTRYFPNPQAENIKGLGTGMAYYLGMIEGKSQAWIDSNILNRYASAEDGKPVYGDEFDEHAHVASVDIEPMRGLPLWLGFDAGLTPAVAIMQLTPDGQLRIIDELCGEWIGMKQFCERAVVPYLMNKYPGMQYLAVWDPAAGTADQGDSENSAARQIELAGFKGEAAPTNDYQPRRDALADFMQRRTSRGAGLLISPRAKRIRKGIAGGYKYKRVQVAGEERYHNEPMKNMYSHPVEGAQYVALQILAGYGKGRKKAVVVEDASMAGYL